MTLKVSIRAIVAKRHVVFQKRWEIEPKFLLSTNRKSNISPFTCDENHLRTFRHLRAVGHLWRQSNSWASYLKMSFPYGLTAYNLRPLPVLLSPRPEQRKWLNFTKKHIKQ